MLKIYHADNDEYLCQCKVKGDAYQILPLAEMGCILSCQIDEQQSEGLKYTNMFDHFFLIRFLDLNELS